MKRNRITEIVKAKNKEERMRLELELDAAIENNPAEKKKVEQEFMESLHENIGRKIEMIKDAIETKKKLKEVSQIVSLPYIAKTYFGKTGAWLLKRVEGTVVDGEVVTLNSKEKELLQKAFKEISEKVGAVSLGEVT